MYVITKTRVARNRRTGLGNWTDANGTLHIDSNPAPAPDIQPVFTDASGNAVPPWVLPGTPQQQQQKLTWILQQVPQAPVRVSYAPAAPPQPQNNGALDQLGKWLSKDVVSGTGVSNGVALSGAGLLVLLAMAKKGGRR